MPTNPEQATWTPAQLEAMKLYGITPPPQQQPQPGQPPPAPQGIPAPGSKEWLDIIAKASGGETKAPPAQAPQAKQAADVIPEPEKPDYKKGSTMWELGFRTQAEYNMAQQKGLTQGPHSGKLVSDDSTLVKLSVYNPDKKRQSEEYVRVKPGQLERETGMAAAGFTEKEWHKIQRDLTTGKMTAEEYDKLVNDRIESGVSKGYLVPVGDQLLTVKEYKKLIKLEGEKQFEYAKELNLYSEDQIMISIGDKDYVVDESEFNAWEETHRKEAKRLKKIKDDAEAQRVADQINAIFMDVTRQTSLEQTGITRDKEYNEALSQVKDYIGMVVIPGDKKAESGVSSQATMERDEAGTLVNDQLDIVRYIQDNKDVKYLSALGVSDEDIEAARTYIAATHSETEYINGYFKERGWKTELPWADFTKEVNQKEADEYVAHVREAQESLYEMVPEKKPSTIIKETALGMVPIYGTYRYAVQAKEGGYTAGEIWGIAWRSIVDLGTLAPVVGQLSAAARGTYLAGKSGAFLSAGMRARELGKAVGYITLAEIKAPFTMIAHPIETLKAGLSPIETIFRGKKIPLSAIETKWNTARLPINMVGDEKTTLQLRDAVTDAMINGKTGRVVINGAEVELTPAAINRLGKPVAISASPDIRPYLDGATVGKGKLAELESGRSVLFGEGRELYVSPTFHSRFAEATATGMKVKNAMPGGLVIRDQKILSQLRESGRIYAGTAEVEARLLKGVDLGTPSQLIMTRTPYGKKLTLAVYGDPFTPEELAKMKVIGSVDTVKQIFKGPIKVNKKAVSEYDELVGMASERKVLNNKLRAARESGNIRAANELKARIDRLDADVQVSYARLRESYSQSYRLPLRTAVFNTTGGVFRPAAGASELRAPVNLEYYKPVTPAARTFPDIGRPRVTIAPPRRKIPRMAGRRLPVRTLGRIAALSPRGRIPVETERARLISSTTAGRVPPEPPERRAVPETPTGRMPVRPPVSGRVPPAKPPIRMPPPKPPIRVVPRPPFLRRPRTDADKRRAIIEAGGMAVTYRRGKLQDSVWHTWYRPGGRGDWQREIIIGEPPRGARMAKGAKSAYRTIQSLGGKTKGRQVITEDTGAVDTRIELGGKQPKISFERDVRLTPRFKRLTPRPPRITPRTPRITPKTPRIR